MCELCMFSQIRSHIRIYTVKNVVCYMTLRSANHTVIRVADTTQCHMIHQLVWYAHFIFYSVGLGK